MMEFAARLDKGTGRRVLCGRGACRMELATVITVPAVRVRTASETVFEVTCTRAVLRPDGIFIDVCRGEEDYYQHLAGGESTLLAFRPGWQFHPRYRLYHLTTHALNRVERGDRSRHRGRFEAPNPTLGIRPASVFPVRVRCSCNAINLLDADDLGVSFDRAVHFLDDP